MGCSVWRLTNGFPSVCLHFSYHLSLSLSFVSRFPHDQLSVYSEPITAVPSPTGIANSFQQWRQRADTGYKRETENENLAMFHLVVPCSLGPSTTVCLPFTWLQAQSTGSQAWPKTLHQCTREKAPPARNYELTDSDLQVVMGLFRESTECNKAYIVRGVARCSFPPSHEACNTHLPKPEM